MFTDVNRHNMQMSPLNSSAKLPEGNFDICFTERIRYTPVARTVFTSEATDMLCAGREGTCVSARRATNDKVDNHWCGRCAKKTSVSLTVSTSEVTDMLRVSWIQKRDPVVRWVTTRGKDAVTAAGSCLHAENAHVSQWEDQQIIKLNIHWC